MPGTATLAHLAKDPAVALLVQCSGPYDKPSPHPVFTLLGSEAVRKFRAETTLADLEARYKCPRCDAPVVAEPLICTPGSVWVREPGADNLSVRRIPELRDW